MSNICHNVDCYQYIKCVYIRIFSFYFVVFKEMHLLRLVKINVKKIQFCKMALHFCPTHNLIILRTRAVHFFVLVNRKYACFRARIVCVQD